MLDWALRDLRRCLAYLIYTGYGGDAALALRVTTRRLVDRKKQQTERNVFQCFVFGPKNAGKSSLSNSFLGRPFLENCHSTAGERYATNVVDQVGVDSRLLRAVAIERPKDADLAVEVVLTEVLPYVSKHSVSVFSNSQENQSSRDPSFEGGNVIEDSADANLTIGANNTDSPSLDSTCNDCVVFDEDDKTISPGSVEMNDYAGLDHVENVDQHQVSVNTENITPIPTQKSREINIEHVTEETADENATELHNLNLKDYDGPDPQKNPDHQLELCIARSKLTENDIFDTDSLVGDCEKGSLCFDSYQDRSDSVVVVNYEDDSALVSRSGQICRVSMEGIIEDAKISKKTLASAKESVFSMMKMVELQEAAAEQAREETAEGGSLILVKVEELKKMLVHAKESKDMHAGEVYGEKAILATEARELQSRLLGLSRERDVSLAILNDMREALEFRLSSAEDVMRAVLLEKQVKEVNAQNTLAELEAIMDKVVQESKILQQEAEENSKLQEFLMDRGCVVDMLQGEIYVICQDVNLLKEKFDKPIPLSQSVAFSQSTCFVASPSSFPKSVAPSLDIPRVLSQMLNNTSPAASITSGESPKSSATSIINGQSANGVHEGYIRIYDCRSLLDDEWYFLDGAIQLG